MLGERCDRGDGPACVEVATLHRELGDLPLAALYAQRACDLGDPFGCAALARAWERGEGIPRDPAVATVFYVSACLGGHGPSCMSAATGVGEADAAEFQRRGCAAEPALCRPRVEPGPPGVDPLDQANVLTGLSVRREEIGACYRRSLAQRPSLQGRVALQIALGGDGRVRAVAVTENLRDAPEVGTCVADIAAAIAYAPTVSGEIAVVPWRVRFEPL